MGVPAPTQRGLHGGKQKDRGNQKVRCLEVLEFWKVGCWSQLDGSREMAQGTYCLAEDLPVVPSAIPCGLQRPATPRPEDLRSFSDF